MSTDNYTYILMKRILSCDWGTSSFRLYLFDIDSKEIIAEQSTPNGILRTFELWKRMEEPEDSRFDFYWRVLMSHLKKMEEESNVSLQEIPILVSGMASSSIGMMELPYKNLPFSLDGSDLNYRLLHVDRTGWFQQLLLISGARSQSNAMRGEETQLVGCEYKAPERTAFIFPGTHSKHVLVENGMAIDCNTYMTGEFFYLLSEKSVLSASVHVNDSFEKENHIEAFELGLGRGIESNILESSFEVRMNEILHKKNKEENYHFLSGLLIGSELKEIVDLHPEKIFVVGDDVQSRLYGKAFKWLNKYHGIPLPAFKSAVQAVLNGQWRIYEQISRKGAE
ncbi:MAG: 2-keto-3-deoxy-galactonokinase [Bacteroidetes bacterium]|nr:MAG: 2-keto-3-deoxy-galactonokinase [Bacteroidota bacterium]